MDIENLISVTFSGKTYTATKDRDGFRCNGAFFFGSEVEIFVAAALTAGIRVRSVYA